MIISSSTNMNNLNSPEIAGSAHPAPDKMSPSDPQLPEPVSDHLFLNNIRPEQAREFLLNLISRKLDVSTSMSNKGVADYSEDVSSANATSNQIISSINKALNLNSENGTAKIDEIKNSVNSGFSEAREIFKNLNILRREFLTEFNDIQNNVNGFLENVTSNTFTQTVDHVE